MLKLWGRRTSINVQKVAWVLVETGLGFKRIDVGGAFGGLDTEDYRAMNPNGRVPTLQDGDLVLWESNAICRHLVHSYSGPLAAGNTADAARGDMWMEWFQNGAYAPFIAMFHQKVRLPQAERDPAKLTAALNALHGQMRVAENALAQAGYLNGAQLSLADVPFAASLYRYFTLDIERPSWPHIERYYAGLTEREAYRDHVMISYESLRAVD